MVPVLRNAEMMSFAEVEGGIAQLAKKARDGKLSMEEMTGGTFTITNGGVFGSMMSTPIINPPQSAILGMHNIVQRPMAINGQVVIRPIMYIALSYDHRMVDGKEAVQFLVAIKDLLEVIWDAIDGGWEEEYVWNKKTKKLEAVRVVRGHIKREHIAEPTDLRQIKSKKGGNKGIEGLNKIIQTELRKSEWLNDKNGALFEGSPSFAQQAQAVEHHQQADAHVGKDGHPHRRLPR